ncbi:HAD-IA family hydrolase [Candidatus Dependentiae bacterium]|nr:HAD-IA family hydrolase [Candidatus Dependentiae bacterium]
MSDNKIYNKLNNLLLITIISLILQSVTGKVILWDLGSTLVETNKLKAVKEIGFIDLMKYNNKFHFKDRIFATLNSLGKQKHPIEYLARNEEKILPDIMCKWLLGEVHGPEVIEIMSKQIKKLDKERFFSDSVEKKVIENAIKFMFNPEKLANTAKPIKKAVKLFKECIRKKDKNGKPLNKVIIFSNWDKLSFEIFYKLPSSQKVFKHLPEKDVIISGFIGMIKPHICAYDYVIKIYNLDPKECILIDDQVENTAIAERLGMKALHHGKDWKRLKYDLEFLEVI